MKGVLIARGVLYVICKIVSFQRSIRAPSFFVFFFLRRCRLVLFLSLNVCVILEYTDKITYIILSFPYGFYDAITSKKYVKK